MEPGEPVETGVRTTWGVWTAPEDGRFTWRLTSAPYSKLLVAVFAGATIEDLQLVGAADANLTSTGFTFDAVANRRYWISAGLPAHDRSAFAVDYSDAELRWGRTPENDDLARAAALSGASGSVSGSNRFATIERGERIRRSGHSSIWWTWEASASEWFRFRADTGALAVYRSDGGDDRPGSLELVGSSGEEDHVEVIFQAQRGVRYHIRLGTQGDAEGGDFTLHWDEFSPVWLKHVGRFADGDTDSTGGRIEFSARPGALAFNGDGTALYMFSDSGLHVFHRDPGTGSLRLGQMLEFDWWSSGALIWDPRRNKLYADVSEGTWRKFAPVDGAQQKLRDEGELEVSGSEQVNSVGSFFMDSAGSFLYATNRWDAGLTVFAFDASGDLRHVQTLDNLRLALIANDDGRVYGTADGLLLVFQRNAETGRLTEVGTPAALNDVEALAISDDDRYLFAVSDDGRTQIFGLEDPSSPRHLDSLPSFANVPFWNRYGCRFAVARNGSPAIDVICSSWAFSVQWRSATAELVGTDSIAQGQIDRFNNVIPFFGCRIDPDIGCPVASPDGKHIYAATGYLPHDGPEAIEFFERVGNELVGVMEDPSGGDTRHQVGDTIASMPTGSWIPDTTSGASSTIAGSTVTIQFDDGGYVVESGIRYSCDGGGGCKVQNRLVELGVIRGSRRGVNAK